MKANIKDKPSDLINWLDEDGIVHIRNSERGTLDRCAQQWWWAWREGLKPKETAKPLWFGEGIHLALAHYYGPGRKRRKDFIDVWREFAKEEAEYVRINVGGLDEVEWIEASALGESMLSEYVKTYEGDKHWDVIATEQEFEVAIPYLDGNGYFILNGTMDGVYRDKNDKRVKLMEHKTAASISVGHLPMDNQAGTYWMVAHTVGREQGWLLPKQNISEITYNFLRKAMPDPRPTDPNGYATNKPGKEAYVSALGLAGKIPTIAVMEEMASERGLVVLGDISKSQPQPLFQRVGVRRNSRQRKMQLNRIQAEVERMRMYVNGALPVTKSPGRNTCPMCAFKDMCELHESGADWTEFRDALFRKTDPYEAHTRKTA